MIWWVALIGSLALLAIILPYGVLLFAAAAREEADTRGMRPCPPVHPQVDTVARLPMAKLSLREYRRICKTQTAFRRQTYIRNPYYSLPH